jgi:pyridoxamine 5'-phosphate oxidase
VSRGTALDEEDCATNPFVQFHEWFDETKDDTPESEAVALVTSTLDGRPSARMVLLRHVDDRSFGWYTNYESRKGHELEVNPHAALLWYNAARGRQIRVEGAVTKMSEPESDAYFASRARGHQLSAHASAQSQLLESRKELEDRVCDLEVRFAGEAVPRPQHWGGYLLAPTAFEFWQHREDRLHDRVRYTRPEGWTGEGGGEGWLRQRLAP